MLKSVSSCRKLILCLCVLCLSIAPFCDGSVSAFTIEELLKSSAGKGEFTDPEAGELLLAEELFGQTLAGSKPVAQLKSGWNALHFDLYELEESGKAYIALKEQEGYRSGRGFYLFRKNSRSTTLLQIPHRFKDEMTGEIGIGMVQAGSFRAGAWNTLPRWRYRDGVKIESDLAHRDNTYFSALTAAFVRQHPNGSIVQLHGFDVAKRKHDRAKEAEAIISSGSRTVTRRVRNTAACISTGAIQKSLIFPEDIRELGATTNATGIKMAQMGSQGFIHIEMSHAYRKLLLKDRVERSRLAECVERAK